MIIVVVSQKNIFCVLNDSATWFQTKECNIEMQEIYEQIHLHSKYFAKCFCGELHYLSRIAKPRRIKYSDEWAISNLQTKTIMVGFAKIDNIVQRGMFCSKSNTNFIFYQMHLICNSHTYPHQQSINLWRMLLADTS